MDHRPRRLFIFAALGLLLARTGLAFQGHDANPDYPAIPFDHKAIQYLIAPSDDPVSRLQKRLDKGEVKLEFAPRFGYLPSLLKLLEINVDSQLLVFSKTSAQIERISPNNPRAIYFNDNVAVGYVHGGQVLEFASMDPKQGTVFYTFAVEKSAKPTFNPQEMTCLKCHSTPASLNIPGITISSVYPSESESPYGIAGAFATDHRIPLEDRWGGWYVTGSHGSIRHRGNTPVDLFDRSDESQWKSQNVTSLNDRLDTTEYLAPTSDIVALMTLEHQTRMANLITRLGWETRVAISDGKLKDFHSRLESNVEELVTYMLFADEAPIRSPLKGVSTFTKTFAEKGPRDNQGRSLRDFDLQKRLFRYPLSYMIYSSAFDSLPEVDRDAIYRKLFNVLSGMDTDRSFERISSEDRRAVLEIVRDTKSNLPAYWKSPQDPH
jgi:hypothetical protein